MGLKLQSARLNRARRQTYGVRVQPRLPPRASRLPPPALFPPQQTVPGPAREPERVFPPPFARCRTAPAGTVGFSRRLDPEEGVHQDISGVRRWRRPYPLPGGIAPVARVRRVLAVAAGVDDEVL